jgi:hypothetical protein
MSPFSIFALLYMTSFLLEMVEKWRYPGFVLLFLGLTTLLIWSGLNRLKFLMFLVLTSAYFVVFRFPDVANHVNLIIYINLVLIVGIIFTWVRRPQQTTDEDYYAMMRPILRASLIAVYFFAGFHKFNTDFFNLEVSCSSEMLYRLLDMVQSNLFGVPIILIIFVLILSGLWGLLTGLKIFESHPLLASKKVQYFIVGLLALSGVIGYQMTFARAYYDLILDPVLLANIVLVLAWELIASLLLFIPRLQAPILLFSWMMHACMAMIGFVDFSSLASSLLFVFIPDTYLQIWQDRATLPFGKLTLHRAYLYYGLCISTGLFSAIYFLAGVNLNVIVIAGALFNLASILFLWPMLSLLWRPAHRPAWRGLSVFNRAMPKFMIGFLLLLCCYAMTPYLGLRTTGNFSMFSNLRTEGDRSNHLLLGHNPLKIWNYQEDVVRFLDVSDEAIDINPQDIDLEGNDLPVVEFRKKIYHWTLGKATVPLTFEYQGTTYRTADIVNEPAWRTERRDWEMLLLDFRVIQPQHAGPNVCRW